MPNSNVPADATLLTAFGYNRRAVMKLAIETARGFIQDAKVMHRNKWAARVRCGETAPAPVLPTWREAMSEALRYAWRVAHEQRAMTPAVAAEIERVDIAILTVQAAERLAPTDLAQLAVLQSRAVALRASLHA